MLMMPSFLLTNQLSLLTTGSAVADRSLISIGGEVMKYCGSGINHFHLSIHNDDPSGTCLPLDPEVWGVNVPFNSITEQFTGMYSSDGNMIYLYEYILPVPFDQIAGNRYWLDISAFSNDPNNNNQAIWRWQEAQRSYYPILCGAANKIDPGILPWTTIQWNSISTLYVF